MTDPSTSIKVYIMAYQRRKSLERLLLSLKQYLGSSAVAADLVVSLDHGHHPEVAQLASELNWSSGSVEVIRQTEKQGLNEHVFRLFELASESGAKYVLFFEDDTMAVNALDAIIRLYGDQLTGNTGFFGGSFFRYYRNEQFGIPFIPVQNENPVFTLQKASSRGWMSTPEKLAAFLQWKSTWNGDFSLLPAYMQRWESNAWEKWVNAYLIQSGKTMLYPYWSVTTGFGEKGDHYSGTTDRFLAQTPVHNVPAHSFRGEINPGSLMAYDAFYEIQPQVLDREAAHVPWPAAFDVDLYGTKRRRDLRQEWVLTSRHGNKSDSGISFGLDLMPVEQNIIRNNPGHDLKMIRSNDLRDPGGMALNRQKFKFRMQSQTYLTILDGLKMKLARWLG